MGKASKKKSQRRAGIGPSRAEFEQQRVSRRMAGALLQATEMARSHQAATRQASLSVWGNATPVPATVPEWAEDSLGDYFFTAKFITDAAELPPLAGAVLPGQEEMIADSAYWEATSNVLIRAVVLDGVPVSDPAIGAVIDRLGPALRREVDYLTRDPEIDDGFDDIRAPLFLVGGVALLEATRSVIADDRLALVLAVLQPRLDAVLAPLGLSPELTGAAVGRALLCAVAHDYLFDVPEDTELLDRLDEDSSTAGNALETLIVAKLLRPEEALLAGLAMLSMLTGMCRTNATSVLGPDGV
jgi:hypothetical protein